MRDVTDDVLEGTRVDAAVAGQQPLDVDAVLADGDAIVADDLLAVLVPRQDRLRRRRRLAEDVDAVALLLDEKARRDVAENRRGWKRRDTESETVQTSSSVTDRSLIILYGDRSN